jgi:hypothetical protein
LTAKGQERVNMGVWLSYFLNLNLPRKCSWRQLQRKKNGFLLPADNLPCFSSAQPIEDTSFDYFDKNERVKATTITRN